MTAAEPSSRRMHRAIDLLLFGMIVLGVAGIALLAFAPVDPQAPRAAFQPSKFTLRAGTIGLRTAVTEARR